MAMDAQQVAAAIAAAVDALRDELTASMTTNTQVMIQALDVEFGRVRSEAQDNLEKVKLTFTDADKAMREEQLQTTERMNTIETAVEDLDLKHTQLTDKLKDYEKQQITKEQTLRTGYATFKSAMEKTWKTCATPCLLPFPKHRRARPLQDLGPWQRPLTHISVWMHAKLQAKNTFTNEQKGTTGCSQKMRAA